MRIGSSLFLLAAGAILAFALQDEVSGIDLEMVGFILMVVGAIGLVVSLVISGQQRRDDPRAPR